MKSRAPLVVEVVRGPVVESQHAVMYALADERGVIAGYAGNLDYLTPPRSCIKMLQAIPFVESGALEKFQLDDEMLALACSSHRGEKAHLMVAHRWLEKIKSSESVLWCGPSWPTHEATRHEMIRKGLTPSPLIHNCSGKHLGLISTALAHGENPAGYHEFNHPVQLRLRTMLTDFTRFEHGKAPWGVDGCGIPTYAVPLQNIAIGMSGLLSGGPKGSKTEITRRILEACKRHPVLVSGTDEFATVLMEKTHGRVIVKPGAEGTYAGLLPEKGLAFAVKVHDGHNRAAEVAVAAILRSHGGLTEAEFNDLRAFTNPRVKNSRHADVGEIRVQKGS